MKYTYLVWIIYLFENWNDSTHARNEINYLLQYEINILDNTSLACVVSSYFKKIIKFKTNAWSTVLPSHHVYAYSMYSEWFILATRIINMRILWAHLPSAQLSSYFGQNFRRSIFWAMNFYIWLLGTFTQKTEEGTG